LFALTEYYICENVLCQRKKKKNLDNYRKIKLNFLGRWQETILEFVFYQRTIYTEFIRRENMNKIKELRNLKGLTIRDLAKISDISPSYISELENDSENIKNPSKDVMDRIAKALEATVPEVFY
jgi:DNA-binding XRE family transcriptional regulator